MDGGTSFRKTLLGNSKSADRPDLFASLGRYHTLWTTVLTLDIPERMQVVILSNEGLAQLVGVKNMEVLSKMVADGLDPYHLTRSLLLKPHFISPGIFF